MSMATKKNVMYIDYIKEKMLPIVTDVYMNIALLHSVPEVDLEPIASGSLFK